MDYSLSGSSVHEIFQARVLEWIPSSFSRGFSWPRNRTGVSRIAGRRFTVWAIREAPLASVGDLKAQGSVPGLGRSPEANGNPLQYSCLENPMDGEAWGTTVHSVSKSRTRTRTWLKRLSTHAGKNFTPFTTLHVIYVIVSFYKAIYFNLLNTSCIFYFKHSYVRQIN